MRKLLSKFYNYLILNDFKSNRSQKIKEISVKIIHFILYPSFRTDKIKTVIRATKKVALITFVSILFVQIYHLSKDLNIFERSFSQTYHSLAYMRINAKKVLYTELMDSVKYSDDYLRYRAWKEGNVNIPGTMPKDHLFAIAIFCEKYKMPFGKVVRLISKESKFDYTKISPKGAFGYTGTMPLTYKDYCKILDLSNEKTPINNIEIGIKMLSDLHNYWKKREPNKAWELTFASYNAGIQRVIDNNNNIPDFPETIDYVNFILAKY